MPFSFSGKSVYFLPAKQSFSLVYSQCHISLVWAPVKQMLIAAWHQQPTLLLRQAAVLSCVLLVSLAKAQCPAVQGSITTGNTTVCSGQSVSISIQVAPANGGTCSGKFTNGRVFSGLAPVAGVISPAYTVTNSSTTPTSESFVLQELTFTDTANTTCAAAAAGISGSAIVTILPLANIAAGLTTPATVCSGSTVSITVANPNGVGGTYNQQITYSGVGHTAPATAVNQVYGTLTDVLTNGTSSAITVRYIFTPIGGNTPACTGTPDTVYVTVNPKPTITCPGNKTQSTDSNACTATVMNIDPAAATTATCSGTPPVISYQLTGATSGAGTGSASGKPFNQGITTVTYYSTDAAGNKDSCRFTVTVNDTQVPVFTSCPSNITVDSDTALCGAIVHFSAAATDNCTTPVSITYSKASGSLFLPGTTPVTIVATDAGGKMAICSFTVTVANGAHIYVNDTSNIGGVYTTVAGSDINGNGTKCAPYATIQKAIAVATAGSTIYVDAGTYREDVVMDKKLILKGANYGIDPNGTGPFAKASVVQPLTSNPVAGSSILYLEPAASGSTIDGFTFDGDNTSTTSNVVINGADIDAAEGIGAYAGIATTTISNNIIKNLNYAGIDFDNFYTNSIATTGNLITHNKFLNIIPAQYGAGVAIANNCYTSITNNKMDSVRMGIHTSKFFQADPGNSHSISNNAITSSRTGIWHYFIYGTAASFAINSNTLNTYRGATNNNGLLIDSVLGTASVAIANNKVNGAYAGINLYNNPTANTITVGANTFAGCRYGIFANNQDGFNTPAQAASNYLVKGASIENATIAGIYIKDNGASTHQAIAVQVSDSTVINNTTTGIKIEGGAASLTFNGNRSALLNGQSIYINQVSNGVALPSATIDATTVLFDSTTGAVATQAQNFAIEDKINHKIDSAELGFVLVKARHDFVTVNSHLSTATTAKIQRGILAADTGFTVNLATGAFTENVVVNKRVTLQGNGKDSTKINAATATGNIISIAADSIALKDMYLEGSPDSVTHLSATRGIYINSNVKNLVITNVKASGHQYGVLADNGATVSGIAVTGSAFSNSGNGFGVNVAGKVANLAIRNTAFDGNIYGLTSKAADTVSASNQNGLTSVSITNSTFSGNTTKGAYFEKLDNAVISNNTFTNNGSVATGAGLEVNLKYGAYSNITISRNMLTNNGAAIDTGSAITVKAHNEAPNYNTTPASLTNVMVTNNEISTAPVAIAVGYNVDRLTTRIDSNKIVATTGIVSYKASSGSVTQVHSNSIQATEYALVNEDTLPNSLNATCNWLNGTNLTAIAGQINGAATYVPYSSSGTDNLMATMGFQPAVACVTCTTLTVARVATNNTCNGGATGVINATASGGLSPYYYSINPEPATMVQPAAGRFTGLPAGMYTITGYGANGCHTTFQPDTISHPTATVPDAAVSIPVYTDSILPTPGSSITFLVRVSEKAGSPITAAVMNLTKQEGYTLSFSPALQSSTIRGFTYPLDNAHWILDNTDRDFSKLTLVNPNQVACLQSVYLAVTLTRTDPNKANFVLTSFLRGINGEIIRNNNSTSFSLVGQ